MKKKKIQILSLLIAIIVIVSTGCSSAASFEDSPVAEGPTTGGGYSEDFAENVSADYAYDESQKSLEPMISDESPQAGGGGDTEVSDSLPQNPTVSGGAPLTQNRKLILNTNLSLETKEFDEGLKEIEELSKEYGGYIESSDIQGTNLLYKNSPRYAYFSIRIPSTGSEDFVEKLSGDFHVVSTSQYTQDITEAYFDTEARLNSLLEQEKRLNALLDADGDLEYLLELERAIAEVRYQIESINNQLKNMDSRVDFSTVSISLSEVLEYENIEKLNDPFGVRVSRAFAGSWKNFVEGIKNTVIVIIGLLPVIILLAIVLIIIIVIARRSRRKIKKATILPNPPQPTPPPQDPPNTFEQTHSKDDDSSSK